MKANHNMWNKQNDYNRMYFNELRYNFESKSQHILSRTTGEM
ncbi:hypothetical protein KL86DYS2_12134 [uncultured Dysgonomonas sp.]|uniref:Uncharacterized protein n=1 Tax=uncultured Dysgonomonas sp. TaxID=206096 RepID=A0A212JRF4_9BACT|nr:hypothetical protein KL86DYS2_12134 [uncultured Dysgonomonas sp.]